MLRENVDTAEDATEPPSFDNKPEQPVNVYSCAVSHVVRIFLVDSSFGHFSHWQDDEANDKPLEIYQSYRSASTLRSSYLESRARLDEIVVAPIVNHDSLDKNHDPNQNQNP